MGALHEGHLALLRHARAHGELVVLSVFVNPTQFGPREDFDRYPRDLASDARLAEGLADLLWAPSVTEIYPPNYDTYVETAALATRYEGAIRPGHFRGVATVVYRLLVLLRPDVLVLGQKDAQQCVVIETMARDLLLPVRVVRHPTVREPDLVALSSRNAYLSKEERAAAKAIPRALQAARAAAHAGGDAKAVVAAATETLRATPILEPDYVALVDGNTFEEAEAAHPDALVALAARAGSTRLIDNAWLHRSAEDNGGLGDQ